MSRVKVIVELPEPPFGYEYTGEFRHLRDGDYGIDVYGCVSDAIAVRVHILRQTRWIPRNGEHVWLLACHGDVGAAIFSNDIAWHNIALSNNLVFKTEAAAQRACEALLSMCKEFDFNNQEE